MRRPVGWLAAALAGTAWAGLLAPMPAAAVTEQEHAAAIARPAVVVVEVRWQGWVRDPRTGEVFGGSGGYQVTSSCTGFAVHADGHLVTAGHCVDPGPQGVGAQLFGLVVQELAAVGRAPDADRAMRELAEHAVVEGATDGSPVRREVYVHRGVIHQGQPRRDTLPAEVVAVTPVSEGDVAVLKVERGRMPALALADSDEPPVGTPILAIGYAGSANRISDPTLEPSVQDGLISNRRTVADIPFYEVSAAATGGMSGGPVIDHAGRVVGLVSHGPAGETQPFNFVAAGATIRSLLATNDVPHQLGPIDHNFQAGLERYFAGEHPAARTYFDAVLAASPIHQQAAEFRDRAAAGGEVPRPGRGWPLLGAVVAGGIAALLAMVAVTLWMVRMSTSPAGPAGAHGGR